MAHGSGGEDQGPASHLVYTATSPDGLNWRSETAPLLRKASVPAALVHPDGRILLYYVDSVKKPSRIALAISRDNGATFTPASIALETPEWHAPVDPCPVLLADGRVRLYYYLFGHRPGRKADEPHAVASAISEDGVRFSVEGVAFRRAGLVDPDVHWDGRRWVMHVMALGEGTVVATSDNGTEFEEAGFFPVKNLGTTKPVELTKEEGGGFRIYGFPQGAGGQREFHSYRSADGAFWRREPGIRLRPPPGMGQITDPFVVRLPDGSFRMFYKAEPPRRR